MLTTVDNVCNLIAKSKVLSPEDLHHGVSRWRQHAPHNDTDGEAFLHWCVSNGKLTDYQAKRLAKGQSDHFFLQQYKLIDRLGQGRMAGLYKAIHPSGQTVAIKVLPPSKVKDPQSFGRFERESRLAVKLKHPNVIRTFHTGADAGLHFLVMEYLEGETLEEILKARGKLTPTDATRVVFQALLGLQHLYDLGIVHRDLRPSTLVLVPGSGTRVDDLSRVTVKLIDVGLGKALFDESMSNNVELTNQGDLLGDPDYMAPEQASDPAGADIRADIYSLGCVFYRALTGQVPFPETNLLRKIMRHAKDTPKPVAEICPKIPEAVQKVIDWMLEKDPAQRYPTPDRAAQALTTLLFAQQSLAKAPVHSPVEPDYDEWLQSEGFDVELVAFEPVAPPPPTPPPAPPRAAPPKANHAPKAPPTPQPQSRTPPPSPAEPAHTPAPRPKSSPAMAAPRVKELKPAPPKPPQPKPAPLLPAPVLPAPVKPAPIDEDDADVELTPPSWIDVVRPTVRDTCVFLIGSSLTLVVVVLAMWLSPR